MADRTFDRTWLRLAATLVATGLVLYVITIPFHSAIESKVASNGPNNDIAEFTAIAAGGGWTAVHLAQFLAMAILTAGVLALYYALNITTGMPMFVNRLAAAAAVVSVALAGVVYAVDGIALKQASDAWVRAPAAEKAARFASAEVIRWLEWGSRSYESIMLGLTLGLFAIAIVWTARIPQPIGYVMGMQGITTIVLGWLTGVVGFAASTGVWFSLGGILYGCSSSPGECRRPPQPRGAKLGPVDLSSHVSPT
jgi:hypothetical protein